MHFLAATTLISSCSHCCFLAERKILSLIKFCDLLTLQGCFFLPIYSWGGRLDPLSKFFSNTATDLKLGSNVKLP